MSFCILANQNVFAKEIFIKKGDNLRKRFAEIKENDVVNIASGEYRVGYAEGEEGCSQFYPWDCVLPPIPNGVKIIGDATNPPQLFGVERADYVLSLIGSKNVTLENLDITDHDSCSWWTSPAENLPCARNNLPYGDQADWGLKIIDAENIVIRNVKIHGLAHGGILLGRTKNLTTENLKVIANAFVNIDGDVNGEDSNSGTFKMTNLVVQYAGFGESYPDLKPFGGLGQNAGGYSDGVGMGLQTLPLNIELINPDISYNGSDGWDWLYSNGEQNITVKGGRFSHNAGQQFKSAVPTVLDGVTIEGDCEYLSGTPGGKYIDPCRARGNAISFDYQKLGTKNVIKNSTISGNGDVLILSSGWACDGTEIISSTNNKLIPGIDFWQKDATKFYYASGQTGNGDGPCSNIQFIQDGTVPTPTPTPTPGPIQLKPCECTCPAPGG